MMTETAGAGVHTARGCATILNMTFVRGRERRLIKASVENPAKQRNQQNKRPE